MIDYEYECTSCGHTWEAEQRITDERLTQCPKCKQETAKRLCSGGHEFQLTGGGWGWNGYGG